jgi:hypothetical protein
LTIVIQATDNLEWYDPAAITTADGSLVITYSETPSHGLNYQGGMRVLLARQINSYPLFFSTILGLLSSW